MEPTLTYEHILELFRLSDERLEKLFAKGIDSFREEQKEREALLLKEREEKEALLLKEREEKEALLLKEREEKEALLLKEQKERHKAFEEGLEKSRQEREKARQEREKSLQEQVAIWQKQREEREKIFEEGLEKEHQAHLEREALFEKERKENYRAYKRVQKQLGEITDTLGKFAMEQVRPNAVRMFRDRGILITDSQFEVVKEKGDGDFLYEVDILMYDTDFIVAIEIKSTLKQDHIEEHLERLELMQQYPIKGTKGMKILGAVAGMSCSIEVARYAMRKGLYVILPNGKSVDFLNKHHFTHKVWEIQ